MAITIRPYQPSDQPQIRSLHDRTPPAGSMYLGPQVWFPDLDDIPGNFLAFWVATEPARAGERVVGMVGVEAPDDEVPPSVLGGRAGVVRLQHMRVAPERQRQGVGRRLTETVVEWARDHSYKVVILETTPQQEAALALYTAMGFCEIGRSMVGRYELVWFELTVSP
jgi:ribosomal protein S18 acetylase RimI-like enzyme